MKFIESANSQAFIRPFTCGSSFTSRRLSLSRFRLRNIFESTIISKHLFALLFISSTATATEKPLNFIEIPIDDLKRVIGFVSEEPGSFLRKIYPDENIREQVKSILTPNIDALAANSLVFTNAHAAAPICNASRVSFMTGLRPDQTGVTENEQIFRKVPGGSSLVTIPQHLKDHGYFTTGVGKFFHRPKVTLRANKTIGSDWPDSQVSWDLWINRDAGSAKVYTKAPYSLLSNMKINFGESKLTLEDENDIINSNLIGELLSEGTATIYDQTYRKDVTVTLPQETPFYIGLGLLLPHEPFIAPPEILRLFDENDINLTESNILEVIDDVADLSPGGKGFATVSLTNGKLGGDFQKLLAAGDFIHRGEFEDGDIRAWKSAVKHYLAAVAVADRSVGRVLDGLANGPYKDNTAIILHSDHGFHLGEKNRFGKNTLWDEATGSVLIVHKPGISGRTIRNSVSLLDIFPTIMSMASINSPDYISGNDLSRFFQSPDANTTAPSLTVHGSASNRQSIRTDRYRYIRFRGKLEDAELYDKVEDPYSKHNLIDSPSHTNLRFALEELFDKSFASEPSTPVLLRPDDMETPIGSTIDRKISAWHADGEAISFNATNLPPGLVLNELDGQISGVPSVVGTYVPEVTATSQTGMSVTNFVWTVSHEDTILPYWLDGAVQIENQDESSIQVSWSGATESRDIAGYQVTLSDSRTFVTNDSMLFIDGLEPWQQYSMVVQSVDLSGNVSVDGPTLSFSTIIQDNQAPSWNSDAVVAVSEITINSADLSWPEAFDSDGIDQYQILITDAVGATQSLTTDTNFISVLSLSSGVEYFINIEAIDTLGVRSSTGPEGKFLALSDSTAAEDNYLQVSVNGTLENHTVEAASGQDYGPSAITYKDANQTIGINGNAWKRITVNYIVTRDTKLSFDFQSSSEALINAIGFDRDYVVSSSSTFQLWGTRRFGKQQYRNYDQTVGEKVSYTIPVGEIIPNGFYEFLTFVSDKNTGPFDNYSEYSNVAIFEGTQPAIDSAPSWGDTAVATLSSIDTNSAIISWPDAAVTANKIVSYAVYANGELIETTSSTTYSLDSLIESSNYTVEIYATDNLGNSATSHLSAVFRTADAPPYWSAESVVTLSELDPFSAVIAWPMAMSDAGNELTYNVRLNNDLVAVTPLHDIKLDGLTASTNYQIEIEVYDENNVESVETLYLEFDTLSEEPFWLAGSAVEITDVTSDSATVKWPLAQSLTGRAIRYEIRLNYALIAQQSSSSITLSRLSPLSFSSVTIVAVDNSGIESSSYLIGQFQTLIPESSISVVENGVSRFAYIQGFGVQDKTGSRLISDQGATLTLTGNRWQYLELVSSPTSDTVVEFDFQSTAKGGIHGIAIENDQFPSASKTFKLFGTRTFGLRTFNNYDPAMGKVRYTIPIGQVVGLKRYLVFINDHDVANPTAQSVFSNVIIRTSVNGS